MGVSGWTVSSSSSIDGADGWGDESGSGFKLCSHNCCDARDWSRGEMEFWSFEIGEKDSGSVPRSTRIGGGRGLKRDQ